MAKERGHWLLMVLVLACLAVFGCNKEGNNEGGEEQTTGGSDHEAAAPADGEALGTQVGEIHRTILEQLRPILEARPEIADLRAQMEVLKEPAIQQLVAIGRQIEQLDEAERSAAQRAIARMGRENYSGSDFAWFQEATNHYISQDFNFTMVELGAFNTLTQYAFFPLLCQQEPEEAARLNITCPTE